MTTKVLAPEIYAVSCACTRGWMKPSPTWWTSWLKHHTCCNRLSWMAALWGRRRRREYYIQDPSRSKHYHDRRQFISLNNTNNWLKKLLSSNFHKKDQKKRFMHVLLSAHGRKTKWSLNVDKIFMWTLRFHYWSGRPQNQIQVKRVLSVKLLIKQRNSICNRREWGNHGKWTWF